MLCVFLGCKGKNTPFRTKMLDLLRRILCLTAVSERDIDFTLRTKIGKYRSLEGSKFATLLISAA